VTAERRAPIGDRATLGIDLAGALALVGQMITYLSATSLVPAAVAVASQAGADISDVHISEPSLENLFLHHTGRSLRD
jgi:hypothetical protein